MWVDLTQLIFTMFIYNDISLISNSNNLMPFEILYSYSNKLSKQCHQTNIKNTLVRMNYQDIFIAHHKLCMRDILTDIVNKKHVLYWLYDNVSSIIPTTELIIFHSTFNDMKRDIIQTTCIAKWCNNHNIIFTMISDIHPQIIAHNIPRLNMKNYVSPYNYRYTFFGNIINMPPSCYNTDKIDITIMHLINDIVTLYPVDNVTLISNSIPSHNTSIRSDIHIIQL